MRNDATIAEMLSSYDLAEVFEEVASTTGDFSDLVRLLRLDKAQDFAFSNLRDVDFSNTDLRGFDFTGADLRNSYGIDVLIDDTTVLDGADVQESCFATVKRERELFINRREAGTMYEALRVGDPYEISNWIHARFTHGSDRHPLLRRANDETAAILCQKLLTDKIDLTKRADLFHHLRSITRSSNDMRELLLHVLASHVSNIPVMQKFIKIAGSMYSADPFIGQALLILTKAQSEQVREASFVTLSKTTFFQANFIQLRSEFMSDKNQKIRRRILKTSAISLGRRNLAALNLNASLSDVPVEQILDFNELLDERLATQIATITRQRERKNEQRLKGNKPTNSSLDVAISARDIRRIIELQEEILCSSPVFKLLFAADKPERYRDTLYRLKSQSSPRRR